MTRDLLSSRRSPSLNASVPRALPSAPAMMALLLFPQKTRHFADNATGAAWVPIGLNVAWPSGDPESYYENLFAKLSQANASFARIWLGPSVSRSFNELSLFRSGLQAYDCQSRFCNRQPGGVCLQPRHPPHAHPGLLQRSLPQQRQQKLRVGPIGLEQAQRWPIVVVSCLLVQ